jgi:hypothetical protein
VFSAPLHSNGRDKDPIGNSLSVFEACLPSRCLAMGIHVTIICFLVMAVFTSQRVVAYELDVKISLRLELLRSCRPVISEPAVGDRDASRKDGNF